MAKLSDLYKEVYAKAIEVGDTATAYKCIFMIEQYLRDEERREKWQIPVLEVEMGVKDEM